MGAWVAEHLQNPPCPLVPAIVEDLQRPAKRRQAEIFALRIAAGSVQAIEEGSDIQQLGPVFCEVKIKRGGAVHGQGQTVGHCTWIIPGCLVPPLQP